MIDPSTLPAPVLEWEGAAARAPRAGAPSANVHLERARALASRLPPSVEGHGGDEALFRCASELATILAEDAAAIEAVLVEVFNPRCVPPWDAAKLRREARRAAMRQSTPEARFSRRVAERAARPAPTPPVAEDPDAAAFHAPADAMPTAAIFVQTPSGNEQWHYDPRRECYRAFGDKGLIASLRVTGADAYVEIQDGRKFLSPRQILNNGPTAQVEHVHVDFTRPRGAAYDPDYADGAGRMLEGVHCPEIEPSADAAVDAWLRAVAGEQYPALEVFIASCAQRYLHRPAIALALTGPHSIGKSVFAKALARMWSATHPVTLKTVIEKFNASMTRCPIVLDDEAAAMKARLVSTEAFREIVQSEARDVEPKGLEKRTLLGCQRFVITGNDATDLRFTDSSGLGALDAMAQRLVHIHVDHEDGPRIARLLARLESDAGRVDLGRLCGHFAHLQATVTVDGGRFIGAGLVNVSAARAALTRGTLEAHGAVFDRVRALLTGEAKPSRALFATDGAVWLHPGEALTALNTNTTGERWDLGRLRAAVAPFRGPRGAAWFDGRTVRAWELDAVRLVEALEVDEERALAVVTGA